MPKGVSPRWRKNWGGAVRPLPTLLREIWRHIARSLLNQSRDPSRICGFGRSNFRCRDRKRPVRDWAKIACCGRAVRVSALGGGFCLCPNPEAQGVASLGAKLQFCNANTSPLEKVQKSSLPFRERGGSLTLFRAFLLIKRISCGRRPSESTCPVHYGRTEIGAEKLKSRGLEHGLGTGPVASSQLVLLREVLRSYNQCPGLPAQLSAFLWPGWGGGDLGPLGLKSDQFRTTFYILACFPTERIKPISIYLLVHC